jgi:uncharacterized membrane protein
VSGSRPSAGAPPGVRVPRAIREFIAVPLLVVLALLVLALASIYGDQANDATLRSVRAALNHLIGKKASATTLQAVATGLVTVTSITFSVLLLAVQQTASNLSPVVFDQFVRRRANQVFLGLFVGLALYAYVVMAAVQDKTPPIIGAFLASVLTVVALGCLLFLVYSTIDQMRPRNVMRQLHDHAVTAHRREGGIVEATRAQSMSALPVQAVVRCEEFGYVESVDLERIAAALAPTTGTDVADLPEVELHAPIGTAMAVGDPIASVRHHQRSDGERIAREVAAAVVLSPAPDLDLDPSTGIADLSNIAWTSGSTSKQNPAIADQALHALRDLAARWVAENRPRSAGRYAIVYQDRDVESILDALYSAVVVAHEAHQHQQAARVLDAYLVVLVLARGDVAVRLRRDLARMEPLLDQLPGSPVLENARGRVRDALRESAETISGSIN